MYFLDPPEPRLFHCIFQNLECPKHLVNWAFWDFGRYSSDFFFLHLLFSFTAFFFISTMQRKQEKPAHFLGAACFDDNSTCRYICPSKQGTILHKVCVRRWFYSSCHKDLRLFLSSFGFVSNLWCTCLYSLLSIGIFDNFIAYILRVRATCGYVTPATRGTSPGPSQWLPWPVFSKNRKQVVLRVWNI